MARPSEDEGDGAPPPPPPPPTDNPAPAPGDTGPQGPQAKPNCPEGFTAIPDGIGGWACVPLGTVPAFGPTGPQGAAPTTKPQPKTITGIPPVDNALNGIGSAILQKALEALDAVSKIKDEVIQAVKDKVDAALPAIGKAVDSINNQLGSLTKGLIPSTLTLVGAALGGVETLLSTFLSDVHTLEETAAAFIQMATAHNVGLGNWVFDVLSHSFLEGGVSVVRELAGVSKENPSIISALQGTVMANLRAGVEGRTNG